jgi:hypothetical protein
MIGSAAAEPFILAHKINNPILTQKGSLDICFAA